MRTWVWEGRDKQSEGEVEMVLSLTDNVFQNCVAVYYAQGEILLGPEVLVLIPFFFFSL